MEENWIAACKADQIAREDVIRFDWKERTFAIYRDAKDQFYATDGLCTHANVHLADGFVMDHEIECPKHNGRFDFTTGQPRRAPVCVALRTYDVKVEDGQVYVRIN